jgi:hypothetical protein
VQSSPSDPWIFELTVANSHGTGQPGFVPIYKLKGVEPNAAWYYDTGYGGQEFQFRACTAVAAAEEVAAEPLRSGERQGARSGE